MPASPGWKPAEMTQKPVERVASLLFSMEWDDQYEPEVFAQMWEEDKDYWLESASKILAAAAPTPDEHEEGIKAAIDAYQEEPEGDIWSNRLRNAISAYSMKTGI